jgi:hypothetical protein
MGHDLTSFWCRGFSTPLVRSVEWAAMGKVNLPVPADFPLADQVD